MFYLSDWKDLESRHIVNIVYKYCPNIASIFLVTIAGLGRLRNECTRDRGDSWSFAFTTIPAEWSQLGDANVFSKIHTICVYIYYYFFVCIYCILYIYILYIYCILYILYIYCNIYILYSKNDMFLEYIQILHMILSKNGESPKPWVSTFNQKWSNDFEWFGVPPILGNLNIVLLRSRYPLTHA